MLSGKLYIGFDRDGTLASPAVPMPEKLVKQLDALQKEGVVLFVASGKSHAQLSAIFKEVAFNPWLIAAENGAHIVIPEQNIDSMIEGRYPDLQQFLALLDSIPLPPYEDEPKRIVWSKKFREHAEAAGEILREFVKEKNLKLDVFVYPDGLGGVDVVPQEIDKCMLLKHIPQDAIIHYFGDSENDLEIMCHSRVMPHTMSNAKEVVKACVKEKGGMISEHPAGLGVSDILHRLFGV